MDDLTTKKWFVYIGDHHEGPFSVSDIQEKIRAGAVTPQHYVWAEGMADWVVMTSLPEFGESTGLSLELQADTGVMQSAEPAEAQDLQAFSDSIQTADSGMAEAAPLEMSGASQLIPSEAALGAAMVETVDASLATGADTLPGQDMAVAADDKTGDLDPKERKRLEKAAAKEAKLAEKARKKAEKEARKAAKKTGTKGAKADAVIIDPAAAKAAQLQALGLGGSGPVARGGERKLPKLLRALGLVAVIAGGGYAYTEGHLDPVIKAPALQQAGGVIKDVMSPVGTALRPYVEMVAKQVPFLAEWISPIPPLEDVAPDEYELLQQAASLGLDEQGPALTIALSTADRFAPSFYVATNLPDGATFDIRIEGIPHTLLNATAFRAEAKAITAGKLGKSTPIRASGGGPVPRGEYIVYVYESDRQPPEVKKRLAPLVPSKMRMPEGYPENRRIVLKKVYFLGGVKDANYAARLKAFHDKLRARAAAELSELKQYVMTLDNQSRTSSQSFDQLRKSRSRASAVKTWNRQNEGWMKMAGQLNLSFEQWSVEKLKRDYLYGKLYYLTRRVGTGIFQTHSLRNRYFNERGNRVELLKKIETQGAQVNSALEELKASIDKLEKTPPSANGMPATI